MSIYEELYNVNRCYIPGQPAVTYSACITYLLEECFFLKYLLYVVICIVVLLCIILVLFIIPLGILFSIYLSALFVVIYQWTHKLNGTYCSDTLDDVRLILSTIWDGFARFWHGYELHGTENLPDGPGLIIYYHGAVPIDYMYFLNRFYILKHRSCYSLADDILFKFPGIRTLAALMCVIRNSKEECLNILKDGHLLGISPGGVREALFSDGSYKLLWRKRKGFAQLAIDAKVPIIPMYTQNVREGFRVFGRTKLARWLYEHIRLFALPPYGGFPVKFRTYIGEPIPYDPNVNAVELATKTKTALQSLIKKHQQIPGDIWHALKERFHKEKKC
ncbi:DGAT1/2-independent enzyme synthesizing storage lipids-like [Elgaria multicarinata webbii]|uniref:DGAT1/2-independent enzyme synthesizing storage lipids-like n=1 Tax=Elgaria multicarinata webbii TaxID=159646 RepID=UPI002FCCCA1B